MGPHTLERLVGDPSGKIWLEAPGESTWWEPLAGSTWRGTLHPLLLEASSQREQSHRRAPVGRVFPGSTHPASSRPLLLSAPGSGHPRPPSLLSPAGLALQVSVCSGLHLPRMLVWLFWGGGRQFTLAVGVSQALEVMLSPAFPFRTQVRVEDRDSAGAEGPVEGGFAYSTAGRR